jgi:hypothetical protein
MSKKVNSKQINLKAPRAHEKDRKREKIVLNYEKGKNMDGINLTFVFV